MAFSFGTTTCPAMHRAGHSEPARRVVARHELVARLIAVALAAAAIWTAGRAPAQDVGLAAQYCAAVPHDDTARGPVRGEVVRREPYDIVTCPGAYDFVIGLDGVVIAEGHEGAVTLGLRDAATGARRATGDDDPLGVGFPLLAVELERGGTALTNAVFFYSLDAKRFRALGSLELNHCYAEIEQAATATVIRVCDDWGDLLYRRGAFPRIRLAIDIREGRLVPAVESMRGSPPIDALLMREADEQRTVVDLLATQRYSNVLFGVPGTTLARVLELIYSGNGDIARRYLDRAWPDGEPNRATMWRAIECQLSLSRYASALWELNNRHTALRSCS
jgi:hypothetical protein